MPKRFTDTEKWKDKWFRTLSPSAKVLWFFLTENCDAAGFWKKDYDLATFFCGYEVNEDHLLGAFNDDKNRIKNHGNYIEILEFVSFQYGHLSYECRPHRPVIDLLEKYQNKGYQKGISTLEEKEQDKEKEIKGIVKGGRFSPPSLDDVKAAFSEKGYPVSEAEKFIAYFVSVGWVVGGSRKPMKNWRGAVATWCGKLRDSGVRQIVPQKREEKPKEPEIVLSNEERKKLIESALPGYGKNGR